MITAENLKCGYGSFNFAGISMMLFLASNEQIEAARKFVKKLTASYFPEKFYNPGKWHRLLPFF